MEEKIKALEERVSKVEKAGGWRFYVEKLLVPVLLLVIGTAINWKIERNRAENQKIELAQKMIPLLFDGKPEQALAAQMLLGKVVEPKVSKDLEAIVTGFYQSRIDGYLSNGNINDANRTIQAVKSVGGGVAEKIIKANSEKVVKLSNKAIDAALKERQGFERLAAGDFVGAAKAFEESNQEYDQYHQVFELCNLLKRNDKLMATDVGRKQVIRSILTDYAAYAPRDILEKLQEMTK